MRKIALKVFIIVGFILIVGMTAWIFITANKPDPIPTNQWTSVNGSNSYMDDEGNPVTGWVKLTPEEGSPNDEEWCLFGDDGIYIRCFDKDWSGMTGVMVDISEQMLFYFDKGDIKLTAHIISGTKGENDTPLGEYEIVDKNRNTHISEPTWDYDIKCWIGFIGSLYGFHDAWWQDDELFDDPTTYEKEGSHGCINMRTADVKKLYNLVEAGTKVIIQE